MAASAASAASQLDSASTWHNWTIWTAQRLPFLNMTRLAPSLDDLVSAGPRMAVKLGRLVDGLGGFQQRVIPEATEAAGNMVFQAVSSLQTTGTLATEAAAGFASAASGAAAGAAAGVAAASSAGVDAGAGAGAGAAGVAAETASEQLLSGTLSASAALLSTESARGLGSLFNYATSKWALCCVATAIILNRTYIFAATRRRVRLPFTIRFLLRILPILSFLMQARRLLQSIQCQTSPDFAQLRWGDPTKHSDLLFAESSPLLHSLSSHLLFGSSDEASCIAARMMPSEQYPKIADLRGSLPLLWPLFVSFCVSHFIETLSCAVQGRPVAAETGITLFEHSLAFAEADAAMSSQVGLSSFVTSFMAAAQSSPVVVLAHASAAAADDTTVSISRSAILSKVNTPPEVLLLAFLSAMSHVTSHILGVLNLQAKFRLFSTGFWALCFMSSIVWSALTFSLDDLSGQSLLRFPTVAIVGFIPHLLVLIGILICCFIYGSALLLAAVSQEPDATNGNGNENLSFRERLSHAHANMQANQPTVNLRIGVEMDFYTALLRVGFDAISMASEAVYLNEDRRVNLRLQTWLEDERYNELQELRSRWLVSDLPGSRYDVMGATGLVPATGANPTSFVTSGFARERTARKAVSGKANERVRPIRTGIGASERSGRWVMAVEYLIHVGRLVLSLSAVYLCRCLGWIGIRSQPRWLRRLVQRRKGGRGAEGGPEGSVDGSEEDELVKEWLDNSKIESVRIHRSSQVDVEHEVRQRVTGGMADISGSTRREEREIDSRLYQWWLKGGWWGETDASGDYEPSIAADEDASSVISAFEEIEGESGWESAGDDDDDYYGGLGQRTPTQQSPMASGENTPAGDLQMEMPELARLLDPRSPEERAEAQALAAHLKSDGIMTRSAFAQFRQRQRAELLATSRFNGAAQRLAAFRPGVRLSPEEEAQLLEELLISRRAAAREDDDFGADNTSASWATGAAGLGPDGPQCVVCQSAPRTIIVWPCRCLSLCDDCRVSLAMNNFDKCVCCRREVLSFSRIYVP